MQRFVWQNNLGFHTWYYIIVHKISAAKRNLVSCLRKAVNLSYLHDLLVAVSVNFLSFFLFFRRLTEVVKWAKTHSCTPGMGLIQSFLVWTQWEHISMLTPRAGRKQFALNQLVCVSLLSIFIFLLQGTSVAPFVCIRTENRYFRAFFPQRKVIFSPASCDCLAGLLLSKLNIGGLWRLFPGCSISRFV